ncbi:VOC family protein [Kitasatospora sp. NBC_00240]|uniref:VOC family protein n=1 Tax=Kitasatospora sp. NBC_00240 TaxID=2903567 RepID=UPI00225623C6|nr:VOC family protein [Kitasatospora sp. NBC_00240]MCX5212677.1 VOC family protein [Kitasatospora sp. NBC_00240]
MTEIAAEHATVHTFPTRTRTDMGPGRGAGYDLAREIGPDAEPRTRPGGHPGNAPGTAPAPGVTATGATDDDAGPLPGGRTDAVVFVVRDAERAARRYLDLLGLSCSAYAGPDTGEPETVSYVLQGPGSRFVLTSVVQVIGERGRTLAAHLVTHGEGVVDLSVAVPDVHYAYDFAVDRGARSYAEPYETQDRHGTVLLAVIGAPGGIRHTLVDRSRYTGPYLPGFVAPAAGRIVRTGASSTD